jgi:hypothetical protein
VYYPLLVGLRDRRAGLFQYVDHPAQGQARLLLQDVGQGAAVQVLHHEVGDALRAHLREAEIGHVHDVRVAQAARGLGLALESFDELVLIHVLGGDYF